MKAGVQWFTKAGFEDVRIKRIGPKWYRGVRRHGLIMGCSVTGKKTKVREAQVYDMCWMPCILALLFMLHLQNGLRRTPVGPVTMVGPEPKVVCQ